MFKKIKDWFLIGIWLTISLILAWITYAAITTVSTWETLTAEKFNELIAKINLLDTQEDWNSVTYESTWTTFVYSWYSGAEYYKDSLWRVHLRWHIMTWPDAVCIFTLPVWYRPEYYTNFAISDGWGYWNIRIQDDWCVYSSNTHTAWNSLDWISFRVD